MVVAFIGVGANLGERCENINKALNFLKRTEGIIVDKVSSLIETDSVGCAGPKYLNGVIKIRTNLTPGDLLFKLLDIEDRLGRKRTFKNAPRTIDLDLLLYGDKVIDQPDLKIPHPRMFERDFVLKPLIEIGFDL